jgi:hypothetical protein
MANANTLQAIRGKSLGNVTTASAFPTVAGGAVRATVGIPADISGGIFDGVPFRVRAIFKAVPGTSGNGTFAVYWNKGDQTDLTTFTNDKVFLTSGAVALGTQAASTFVLSAMLIWDSAAQRLAGVNETSFHTIATPAALFSGAFAVTATNNPVATSVASVAAIQFFATALFGTGNASNAATLTELSIEQV